ncbi:MAG: cyclic 2,3-diphosphoglycerate synthase [Candidatus Bilamarchaeum sp.]|jgi:predicted GTPase
MKKNVLILGAAGRDFHNFLTFFKDNSNYNVVGFTATQIPNIAGRKFPYELAGKLYPKGIPIFEESELEKLIEKHEIDEAYFSYSDVSHKHVMNMASRVQANGASFVLLGPRETMLKSKKRVIAITAVRTGAGKTTLCRYITKILRTKNKRFALLRHPMPYGDLIAQKAQKFETLKDLDKYNCTIEEREEFEPHLRDGTTVYAGVDYAEILKQAEKEAEIIIWDGGNNDIPFIKPDIHIVVADALRPGHEVWYYPGETNFRAADIIVINKVSENPTDLKRIIKNAKNLNPEAEIIQTDMDLSPNIQTSIKGKNVIVVEDGPSVTHGGMRVGAGYEFASAMKAHVIDPKKHAVGSIKQAYKQYEHLNIVVPAMGYYGKQLKELEETINRSNADFVVAGTPVSLGNILKTKIPIIQVNYSIKEKKGNLEQAIRNLFK